MPNAPYFQGYIRQRIIKMERDRIDDIDRSKPTPSTSKVKAVIAWLAKADREFRVAQSMVDKTHNRF